MILQNKDLTITFAEPGTFYEGTRFDWSSQIISIKNAQGTEYLSNELYQNHSNKNQGFGLASEFGIRKPVGYDDASPGEWFPKIGVGWLKKENMEDYFFMHKYELELPVTTISRSESMEDGVLVKRISCTMDSGLRRGYAWRLSRTWVLRGNTLSSEVLLHNSGEKEIATNEYCHNFFHPGPIKIDNPDTAIAFSFQHDINPRDIADPYKIIQNGKLGISFSGESDKDLYLGPLGEFLPPNQSWTILYKQKPWVREILDSETLLCAFWGKTHVLSPELYLDIQLKAGESKHWKRTWIF